MKMKHLLTSVAALAMLTLPVGTSNPSLLGTQPAQAQDASVSIGIFYDGLAEHGTWVRHSRHRHVWIPSNVDADWAPYTRGHWVHTDRNGWYFVSDEPFAWAAYHYGRWAYEPRLGWYWVPGTVWAPAWVSWRRGGDHVGWAPLPPEGDGFAVSIEIASYEPPRGYWHFVPVNDFVAVNLSTVIIRDRDIYDQTEYLGPVVVQNNIVINNIIDIDFIRENTDEEIPEVEVRVVNDPAEARTADEQGVVAAFEGELAVPAEDAAPEEVVEPDQVEAATAGQEDIEPIPGETDTLDAAPAADAPADAEDAPADEADTAPADAEEPEAAPADANQADDAPADAEEADTAPADAEEPEAAPADAEETETAPADAAPSEAPAEETAPADAAPVEAPEDAAPSEAPAEEVAPEEAPAAAPSEAPAEEAPAEDPAPTEAPADAPAEAPAEEAPAEEAAPDATAPAQPEDCSPEDQAANKC